VAERPTPFTLAFAPLAEERFGAVRASFATTGADPGDRDAFVLDRAVVELLRDLVPDEHDPEQIPDFVATLHHAYLFWRDGQRTVTLARAAATELLAAGARVSAAPSLRPSAYLQFPERLVWAQLGPEEPHEPLDGIFVHAASDAAALRALGVFGLHPDRPGFSVAEVTGPRPVGLARADGSALYSPVLPGGDSAGLHSLVGTEELLELAWRGLGRGA
jgi:hypothetical protein